jgi:hypothetical protein
VFSSSLKNLALSMIASLFHGHLNLGSISVKVFARSISVKVLARLLPFEPAVGLLVSFPGLLVRSSAVLEVAKGLEFLPPAARSSFALKFRDLEFLRLAAFPSLDGQKLMRLAVGVILARTGRGFR